VPRVVEVLGQVWTNIVMASGLDYYYGLIGVGCYGPSVLLFPLSPPVRCVRL